MNYLIFNNSILFDDGAGVKVIDKTRNQEHVLLGIDKARICVVDVDVLIAAAVEYPVERKDSILVRKFKELYQHENYIIQDERIDSNLFQVLGIKEQRLREIYSLVPPEKVELLIPYGIALRNTLINKKMDTGKTIVFVDDFGNERLLTVFNGMKFSRTRVIANSGEDILPEIKRSQIDFFKKTEEFLVNKSADFLIVVNNQELANEISKNKEKLQVEYLNIKYPAMDGLKAVETYVNYRLPEENIKRIKEIDLKKKISTLITSLSLIAVGFLYFIFNEVELSAVNKQYQQTTQANEDLENKLDSLDAKIYRADLRSQKTLDYGIPYLAILEIIPTGYSVETFKFTRSGNWNIEMTLFADKDVVVDPIPRKRILKNAEIKDIYVNNQPGKYLRVSL